MSRSNEYSLEQLLKWSLEDRLIDGYEQSDDHLVILQKGNRFKFAMHDARTFLKGVFRTSTGTLSTGAG